MQGSDSAPTAPMTGLGRAHGPVQGSGIAHAPTRAQRVRLGLQAASALLRQRNQCNRTLHAHAHAAGVGRALLPCLALACWRGRLGAFVSPAYFPSSAQRGLTTRMSGTVLYYTLLYCTLLCACRRQRPRRRAWRGTSVSASSVRARRPALSHAVHLRGALCAVDGGACASVAMAQGLDAPRHGAALTGPSLRISKGVAIAKRTSIAILTMYRMLCRSSVPTCRQHGHQSSTALGTARVRLLRLLWALGRLSTRHS